MFNKKKNIENLLSQYIYLKSLEQDDINKLEEINSIKEAFENKKEDTICHVPLNGNLDFVKRNFDNDFSECQYLLNSCLKKIQLTLNNLEEFEMVQDLVNNKLELKLNLMQSNIGEVQKISNKLETINNQIEKTGNDFSSDIQLEIKNELSKINDLIDRMVSDKYASNEAQDYIDAECAIIKRNSDRKRIEEKLKKYNIISDTVDNINSQKL